MLPDDHVFDRIQACTANLVGGSGHLTSYDLDRDTFVIEATRDLGAGHTQYEFVVEGVSTTEFTGIATEADPEAGQVEDDPGSERLRGTIVLDADGGFVLDGAGQIRLEPWRTLDPSLWPDGNGLDDLLDELLEDT